MSALGAIVATAPPVAPAGFLWWDAREGRLYVRDPEAWVGASAPSGPRPAEILAALGQIADLDIFVNLDGETPFTGKQSGVAPAATGDNDVLATAQWVRDRAAASLSGQYMPIAGGAFSGLINLPGGYRPVRALTVNIAYFYYASGGVYMQADATYMGRVVTSTNMASAINAVQQLRLVWAGSWPYTSAWNTEQVAHMVMTTSGYTSTPPITGRYIQYYRQDGAWYTAAYA